MNAYLLESAVSARLTGAADFRIATRSADRLLGAFYTDTAATRAMANWMLRGPGDRILEPSFGDGAFLRALRQAAAEAGCSRVRLFGAELVHEVYQAALKERLLSPRSALLGDFLAVKPFEVDGIIGNPPYVRLRHLPRDQIQRALHAAQVVLRQPMDPSGSVWMPFVLHSMRFLRRGGRLALVLPHELTYVRYARPLWRVLGQSFDHLRVVRVYERLFSEILQEVVVLFADGFGGATDTVGYQHLEHARDFAGAPAQPSVGLRIADIAAGKRVFVQALLPQRTRSMVSALLAKHASPLPERCVFNIGYVSGDKDFFHPSEAIARRYGLPEAHLHPALTSGRQIRRCGLHTSNGACTPERLYLPPAERNALSPGDQEYIASGRATGIHKRYKCRVRKPWHVVPGVRTPDVVLSVFAERPVMVINDARYVASNSLLCGYLRGCSPESLAVAWYTSLTLLQCELHVHALGGGVLILIPGEVAGIRLPDVRPAAAHIRSLDAHLSQGDIDAAYQCGDELVLQQQLGLGTGDIDQIREGIQILRYWRNSATVRHRADSRRLIRS